MVGEHSPLSIIPSEAFRWRPRVQYIEAFRTKASAIDYALKHGYNLIVERNEGTAALFDVLLDIDEVCTEGLNLELTHSEEVLVDPEIHGWAVLTVLTLWRNCKLFASSLVAQYRQNIAPFIHRTASRCWWSKSGVSFRRWWHRHSDASVADLAKRFGAFIDGLYMREIAPRLRRAFEQCRQADVAGSVRRVWNSPLLTFSNFATRFAAAAAVFLNPEVAPFVLQAATNLRRAHLARAVPGEAEAAVRSRNSNPSQLG